MERVLIPIVLIGFISLAIFGSGLILLESMNGHGHCLSSVISGTSCPRSKDFWSFVLHQIAGLETNFHGVVSSTLTFTVVLLVSSIMYTGPKISHWLALHENSPAF